MAVEEGDVGATMVPVGGRGVVAGGGRGPWVGQLLMGDPRLGKTGSEESVRKKLPAKIIRNGQIKEVEIEIKSVPSAPSGGRTRQ
jgi:hypothetical protein